MPGTSRTPKPQSQVFRATCSAQHHSSQNIIDIVFVDDSFLDMHIEASIFFEFYYFILHFVWIFREVMSTKFFQVIKTCGSKNSYKSQMLPTLLQENNLSAEFLLSWSNFCFYIFSLDTFSNYWLLLIEPVLFQTNSNVDSLPNNQKHNWVLTLIRKGFESFFVHVTSITYLQSHDLQHILLPMFVSTSYAITLSVLLGVHHYQTLKYRRVWNNTYLLYWELIRN